MDPILANLYKVNSIGNDGFQWWIGQVEEDKDVKPNGSRVRVRIVGTHHREGAVTPTDQLPWAHVMMPNNVPYSATASQGTNNLRRGAWVMGFFLDPDGQVPMVMGSVNFTPGTTNLGLKELPQGTADSLLFGRYVDQETDLATGSSIGGAAGATTSEDPLSNAQKNLNGGNNPGNPTGAKDCIEVANAKKCKEPFERKIRKVLAEILAVNQSSGGKLGSYYVGKANGFLLSAESVPREGIAKINRIVSSLGSRIKKEMVLLVRKGIEELIKLITGVKSVEKTAKQAADKPKSPLGSFEPKNDVGKFLKEAIDGLNEFLGNLGCSFTKTLDDLINFVTDLVFGYLEDAFNAANCLIDSAVNSITRFLQTAYDGIISEVLGPIQDLLSEAGSFLDIVGGAINKVLSFLGISCTGLEDKCNKSLTECAGGSKDTDNERKKEKNALEKTDEFLDNLIKEIENGSLTGDDRIGSVPVGVCKEARERPERQSTEVQFIGGVLNKTVKPSYVSSFTKIPEYALQQPNIPTDFPNVLPDSELDKTPYIEYTITPEKDRYDTGETVRFELVGPERNGVLEIEVLSSSTISSEAGETYDECVIDSADGFALGLTVQVSRDEDGIPFVNIVAPGTGFLVGMEFTLLGDKLGGVVPDDDITFRVTKVGEELDYRLFGDALERGVIDKEIYTEFRTFIYSEPRTFTFPTIQDKSANPSILGMLIVNKRAAASVEIWDDDPANDFPEIVDAPTLTITPTKDVYVEGENIVFNIETTGYNSGTVFDFQVFGTVSENDYNLFELDKKITIDDDGNSKITILTVIDTEDEGEEELSIILTKENDPESQVGASSVIIVDSVEELEEVQQQEIFELTPNTTNEEFREFLNSQNLTVETDFSDFTLNLPGDLQLTTPPLEEPEEPDEFLPPIAGDPVVDEDGSIISIPIDFPGNRSYQVPPQVAISGDGYGASAIALLDSKGFVSEIRVTRTGLNYVPNLPTDNGTTCVIDSFTIIRTGFNYTTPPTLFVDGRTDVGEITINEDGFISGVRVLNRSISYDTIPEIVVSGGDGSGGFVLPSLVCLPPLELETKGYVKIGTGSYIDCP